MVFCGVFFVLVQARPFWVDEWRVIYNLKYKSPAMLWGQLDYMQQFPRVYLQLIKAFAAPFDYSYFTLRFPPFAVGTFAMYFCYRLMNRIYKPGRQTRFLFILILFSSYTATEYYVQVKQYTMDILTSLIAIWQLLEVFDLFYKKEKLVLRRYLLLLLSFIVLPFFSYTYSIAITPVFIVALLHMLHTWHTWDIKNKARSILLVCMPLFCCAVSIIAFYIVDASQVMADGGMQDFWGMKQSLTVSIFSEKFYRLFANVGAGLFFEILFGTIGITAFIYGSTKSFSGISKLMRTQEGTLVVYSVLICLLTMALYIARKIPIETRLNVYTVPAIAILIIYLLDHMKLIFLRSRFIKAIPVVLFLGLSGNIFSTYITLFAGLIDNKMLSIYVATEDAIIMAQKKKLPILTTPKVAYPYQDTPNLPDWHSIPGDWVLKTFPAYKVDQHLDVYPIDNTNDISSQIQKLPPGTTEVLVGDGFAYHIVKR